MKYRSTYLEADGSVVTAVLQAEHEQDLLRALHDQGRTLVQARPLRSQRRLTGRSIPEASLIAFTKSMAALLRAGVPVLKALDAIRTQESDPRVSGIYTGVMEKVEAGQSLAESLAAYPRAFSRLYVEMLRAGEMTGGIDASFQDVGRYLAWQKNLRGLIKQAVIYPCVLLVATYGLMLAMLGFTIPRLTDMISNIAPDELPTSTKVLVILSDFVSGNMLFVLVASAAAAFGAILFLKSRIGGRLLTGMLVHMPVASGVVLTLNRSRMCRSLSMLLQSGVTPINALNMTASIVMLPKLSDGLRVSADRLMDGEKLTDAFKRADLLPGLHLVMVRTGEESGQLADAFAQVGDTYDEQSEEAVKRAIAILEPTMTCVLAGIVVMVAGVVLNTLYGAMAGMT